MDKLSSVLTYLMAKQNMSSAELARKTNVAQPVVYRLMTGVTENPQVLTIMPIANYFGISIDQLLGLAPLRNQRTLDDTLIHSINTKLSTIKTIASVLVDFLPGLIEGYEKAIASHLAKEIVPTDILPLLMLNTANLLKTSNQIHELLTSNNKIFQD